MGSQECGIDFASTPSTAPCSGHDSSMHSGFSYLVTFNDLFLMLKQVTLVPLHNSANDDGLLYVDLVIDSVNQLFDSGDGFDQAKIHKDPLAAWQQP